jgi:DNA repair protein SbcD/Mre11
MCSQLPVAPVEGALNDGVRIEALLLKTAQITMRLLHFSDLHIGMENYGRVDPATGLSTRLADFLAVLDQVVDYALGNQVDLVIFTGDAYKTRDPNPTHQREFARRLRRLSDAGVSLFLLVGNHDLPNAMGRAHSVEIFDTLAVARVYVARRVDTIRVDTLHGPIQVVALPWIIRSNLLSRDEFKSMPLDKLDGVILGKLAGMVDVEVEKLDRSLPAILCAHGTIEGATYGSERSIMLGQDMIIPKSIINHPAFSYVALGHIHKHQVVNENPPAVYAGSLERIDFGEEQDDKGFVIVDLDETGKVAWSFVPVKARRFLTIKVDAGYDDPTDAALSAIAHQNVTDSVVKLIVQGRTEVSLREDEVRRALGSAYFIAAIVRETERTTRGRLGNMAVEQMTAIDALSAYLKVKAVPEERAQVLLEHARQLLAEAETR